ncbi:MAG TPA: prolipoprotein diacylglyceryl transferase [Candidatus Magasanikbacteria bacterium]|nr:prolipoprotein diacylglyceryl transferase [Candidatus Magasanikbacteria bacterium]
MLTNTIDPILLSAGPITVRWYGLFLALGVLSSILVYQKLFKKEGYKVELVYDLSIWMVIGGLIGARLGHVFFYNWAYFSQNIVEIIFINHGGLSSHGMTIGLLVTLFLYKKIKKIDLKKYIDILVIPIPLLAAFIRLGNFFNSEIIGKPTNLPWGVWFQRVDAEILLRHPSQIYESLIALTVCYLLFTVYKKYKAKLPQLFIFNLFLLTYFSTRFLVEFLKERQGIDDLWILSMGQLLSIPFGIWSVWWFIAKYTRKTTGNN